MSYSSYDIAYDVRYDASLARLASLPSLRRRMAELAVRAHRMVAGLDPAPSAWRPSQRLMDVLDSALPGGQPGPSALYRLGEPDHPEWNAQSEQLSGDLAELSAADRELVIEFTRMLREMDRKRHYSARGRDQDQE